MSCRAAWSSTVLSSMSSAKPLQRGERTNEMRRSPIGHENLSLDKEAGTGEPHTGTTPAGEESAVHAEMRGAVRRNSANP